MLNDELKNKALDLLTRREHSLLELQHKLQARGFELDEVFPILDNLQQSGLQSDERFAENYVHYRSQRGFGPNRIEMELKQKGVSGEIIAKFVVRSDEMWQQIADQVVAKKFGKNPDQDFITRAKISKFLNYRGF